MEAKDKAKQLVDKFLALGMIRIQAKQCAVICVEEILSFLMDRFSIGYWQEVKQEIKKL